MGQPYIGEIRMFGGSFAPAGWAFCDGSIIQIAQNATLYNLIGTTYGGDGVNTFGLPDLRGRAPVHQGSIYVVGQMAGTEQLTLTQQHLPAHTHGAIGAKVGDAAGPVGNYWSTDPGGAVASYLTVPPAPNGQMNAGAISAVGGDVPHENMQPFLTISYIISLFGIFPSQN